MVWVDVVAGAGWVGVMVESQGETGESGERHPSPGEIRQSRGP